MLRSTPTRFLLGWALGLLGLICASWGVFRAEPACAQKAEPLVVLPGRATPNLRPIAPGVAHWLGQQLSAQGVPVRPGDPIRHSLRSLEVGSHLTIHSLLEIARANGATRAVITDLSVDAGHVAVLLRVHDVASGRLLGSGRADGPAGQLGVSLQRALRRLLPVLGLGSVARVAKIAAVQTSALGAYARALERLDAGDRVGAWRELTGVTSMAAGALREQIERRAAQSDTSKIERARLMAECGRAEEAWKEILREASEQRYAAHPRAEILVAAGEIQLQRRRAKDARAYFERASEVAPDNAEAALGLARALTGLGDAELARQQAERARLLSPGSAEVAKLLAELPGIAPRVQAPAALRAAELARQRFEPAKANRYFERAIELDSRIAGEARTSQAAMQLEFGEPAAAARLYRDAVARAGDSPERQLGLARSLRALHRDDEAEAAYRKTLAARPAQPDALRELGEIYSESQREAQAQPLLERAIALAPEDGHARLALAENRRRQGDLQGAETLLLATPQTAAEANTKGLRSLARIQRGLHEDARAQATLERAIKLDPTSIPLRRELAALYETQGKGNDAVRQRKLAGLLGGEPARAEAPATAAAGGAGEALRRQLDVLLTGFGPLAGGGNKVALLGVRESLDRRGQLLHWLYPLRLDVERVENEFRAGLEAHYEVLQTLALDDYLEGLRDSLFDYGSRRSLDAESVAQLNAALRSDALFVAVARTGDNLAPGPCGDPSLLHVELRRLAGRDPLQVQILANEACLPAGLASHASWNGRAAALWGALLALLAFPFVRGFGTLVVRVKLPEQTRALFSVSLTRRPRKVSKKRAASELEDDAMGHFNQRLRKLKRSEKRLDPGEDMIFRWVPARSAKFYVTVHGPLFHSISEQLVGEFLEEHTVVISRGRTSCIEFDLGPKECPVEVSVFQGERAIRGAQISVRGRPETLRYTSNGSAFLYLPTGHYSILAGAHDRAGEREIRIDSFEPLPLVIDLAAEGGLVFKGCPDAVGPFLEGHFDAAALALDAGGEAHLAKLMRARAYEQRGEIDEAARTLQSAGEVERAAALLAERADGTGSAALFEEAGEFGRAAEAHLTAGDVLAAARNYEAAYDFPNAIECYRQLGENERVLDLLEKSAEYLDAGRLCLELGESQRAVHDLQQVETRHPFYSDACRMLGELLCEQGREDFALEKFDEAVDCSSVESFPIGEQDRYARLLEGAGRLEDAVGVLHAIRRTDMHYGDIDTRLAELKRQITLLAQHATTRIQAPPLARPATPPAEKASRYEIIQEIGRGGMGVVFKARDRQLDRVVALKRLPDNLQRHPAAIQFFEREARSAARLNHPNIVTVYDAGQENGHYFISMELLEGTPLDAIVRKHGALPPRAVARLGVQIAAGLHFAHRNKIIHRDIKTANLFLTRDKIVKIMDFGLAKMVEEVRKGATVIGGTPYYMAPEQAAGGAVDYRADLYALGVTLFQMAAGEVPFREGDVVYQHRHTPPPDPRELCCEIPAAMAELILSLMRKEPADRPQSAAEVARVLQGMADAGASA